jgi:organic hydroperoxide reductase OsmC/OhrA
MDALPTVALERRSGLQYKVDFAPGMAALYTDATPPLGQAKGPDSEMLLMAAVGNCLAASLAFSLDKYKNESVNIKAVVGGAISQNDQGRLRMHSITVDIGLGAAASSLRFLQRALEQYEDFCVVTQSVRAAIPVTVRVFDSDGVLLTA